MSLVLGLDNSDNDSSEYSSMEYSLTDKVIYTYNNEFCQSLTLESTDSPRNSRSNATLYLLNKPPSLSSVEYFEVNETSTYYNDYDREYCNWNFNLNEGTRVSLITCLPSHKYLDVTFYVIRDSSNFSKWQSNPLDSDYVLLSRLLSSRCTRISYNVSGGGKFYFVLYGEVHTGVSVDFQFQRTVYRISPDTIAQKCTIPLDGQASCSVDVPLSSDYTALLSLNTSLPVDYKSRAHLHISCQTRGWLYAVIVLCTIVPVIVASTLVIVCVCVIIKRRRDVEMYGGAAAGRRDAGNVDPGRPRWYGTTS